MNHLPGLEPQLPGISSAVTNTTTTLSRRDPSRLNGIFRTHGGERDMNAVFGYPLDVTYDLAFEMFRRQGIATRITRGIARSCWRDIPDIKASPDEDAPNILVDEIAALNKRRMFRKLEQADTLNRIGKFSVLYVGVQDGLDPRDPLGIARGSNPINDVFFSPYSEEGTEVFELETEVTNPRFGLPLTYQLQVRAVGEEKIPTNTQARVVHWSRVVHLAEDALDNEVIGFSALEPIYNYIIDLMKSEGGSSEAYWRNARRVFAFMAKEGFGNATPEQIEQLKLDMEAFTNGWRDAIRLGNITAEQFQVEHADPKETILGALKLISAATSIPLRILTGEGGGQTTGNEDKAAYNQIIFDRQEMMCSDWLFQTLGILANAKIIPPVPDEAVINWPITEALNELQASEVKRNNAQALSFVGTAFSPMGGFAGGEMGVEQAIEEIFGFIPVQVTDGFDDNDMDDIPPTLPGLENDGP